MSVMPMKGSFLAKRPVLRPSETPGESSVTPGAHLG